MPLNQELYSPAVQTQIRNFLKAYIIVKVATRSDLPSGDFDKVLGQLGQEAIPALVDAMNVVASLGLGDC
jgi:hypothetical protein